MLSDWIFYEEQGGESCVAILKGSGRTELVWADYPFRKKIVVMYEGAAGVFLGADPDVATTGVSHDYLDGLAVVDEARVRQIHPKLIAYLEEAA